MTTSVNRRGLAGALAGLVIAEVLFAVVHGLSIGWGWQRLVDTFVVTNGLMGLTFGLCGAVIAWYRPANPIGWLFLADGIGHATTPFANALAHLVHGELAQRLLVTVSMAAWPWSIGLFLPLALLLFPTGRLLSPRWRWAAIGIIVTAPLFVLEMIGSGEPISPDLPFGYLRVPNFDALQPLWTATEVRNLLAILLAVACLTIRYRRADETGRRQLLWLLLASVIAILFITPWAFVAGTPILVLLAIPLIPISVAVAIVRYQLLDIRLVVTRALTWALLSLVAIGIYAALVALLDSLIASQVGRSAAVTVFVALIIAPVLPRLQQLVDRALYGDRNDPARVASRVGEQLSAGLPGVLAAIRSALRLPYAGLTVDGVLIASTGTPPPDTTPDSAAPPNGTTEGPVGASHRTPTATVAKSDSPAAGPATTPDGTSEGPVAASRGTAAGSVAASGDGAMGSVGASGGDVAGSVVRLELSYGGEVVGVLEVGVRSGEAGLSSADRSVLGLVAVPLAVAVHATRLSAELQSSREKLVSAREEERRRLRRDLHDGLGPTLTGVAFSADAAANLITTDSSQAMSADAARAVELLARLRADTRSAITDVRRLVEDLRPPALDELGLVEALRQRADQLSFRADGRAIQVKVAAEGLPTLPAALEVAAYRIATEALTNVVRHSAATSAVLTLRCTNELEIEVVDDGPSNGAWHPGVGLQAMHERAAELGGTFQAGPTPTGGRLQAHFPLPTTPPTNPGPSYPTTPTLNSPTTSTHPSAAPGTESSTHSGTASTALPTTPTPATLADSPTPTSTTSTHLSAAPGTESPTHSGTASTALPPPPGPGTFAGCPTRASAALADVPAAPGAGSPAPSGTISTDPAATPDASSPARSAKAPTGSASGSVPSVGPQAGCAAGAVSSNDSDPATGGGQARAGMPSSDGSSLEVR
ncbi:MAG TPA: histidine kinase [Kribbella sp.]